jgi:hypothetical protein
VYTHGSSIRACNNNDNIINYYACVCIILLYKYTYERISCVFARVYCDRVNAETTPRVQIFIIIIIIIIIVRAHKGTLFCGHDMRWQSPRLV